MPPDDPSDEIIRKIVRQREEIKKKLLEMEQKENDNSPSLIEDSAKKIKDSNTDIILHVHKLLRIGMTCLFWLFVVFLAFTLSALIWMLFKYVGYIVQEPEQLKLQLTHIWTVLSGAFVVVFFQFVVSIGKKISSNGSEKG